MFMLMLPPGPSCKRASAWRNAVEASCFLMHFSLERPETSMVFSGAIHYIQVKKRRGIFGPSQKWIVSNKIEVLQFWDTMIYYYYDLQNINIKWIRANIWFFSVRNEILEKSREKWHKIIIHQVEFFQRYFFKTRRRAELKKWLFPKVCSCQPSWHFCSMLKVSEKYISMISKTQKI